MKRIKYLSRCACPMTSAQLDELVAAARVNNAKLGITGALTMTGNVFFQILEGSDDAIDALFAKIEADPRHADVVVLAEQTNRDDRLFPDWGMRRVSIKNSPQARTVEAMLRELAVCDVASRAKIYEKLSLRISEAIMAA